MSPPPTGPPLPFAKGFAASAMAACGAEALTLPLDMAKVRLQLQKTGPGAGGGPPKYRGLLGTVATVAREEGAASLWRGLVPALHRQVVYGGLRIGLYEPVKAAIGGDGLASKVAAGLATGALAIAVASPTDLVKVRMQADGVGAAKRYPSALGAYGAIVRAEGLRALWTGLGPNVGRNAVRCWPFFFFFFLGVLVRVVACRVGAGERERERERGRGRWGWWGGVGAACAVSSRFLMSFFLCMRGRARAWGPVFSSPPLPSTLSPAPYFIIPPPLKIRSSTPPSWPPTTSASPPSPTRARRATPF